MDFSKTGALGRELDKPGSVGVIRRGKKVANSPQEIKKMALHGGESCRSEQILKFYRKGMDK